MEIDGDFNGSPVMTCGASGMVIQSNGQNSASKNIDADSMPIIDEASFELLPLYNTTETSWYSSSSEDIEAFDQFKLCNISSNGHSHPPLFIDANNIISTPQNSTLYKESAFGSYLRPYTHTLYVINGRENLMKRCFKFLRKIDEKRREMQKLSQVANIQEHHQFNGSLQSEAAFHHMIAERNRRNQLKQQFSLLHSLLPQKSKRDKYSVLSATFKYISDLKRRVNELEQRNRALEESLRINISKKEGCSSSDQRHEEHQARFIYSSDEVVLEQSKQIPNQIPNEVVMRINVQIDPLSSPTSLIIVLLERLKEVHLDVVIVQSNVQTFKLEAHLLLTQIKAEVWESSKWENAAKLVKQTLI